MPQRPVVIVAFSNKMGKKMKFKKLYSDAQGESHWKDIEVELEEQTFAPPAKAIEISQPEAVVTSDEDFLSVIVQYE